MPPNSTLTLYKIKKWYHNSVLADPYFVILAKNQHLIYPLFSNEQHEFSNNQSYECQG